MVCHAKGVSYLLPSVRTVIDVGDLYTKVLRTDVQGNVQNFLLSGKCAGRQRQNPTGHGQGPPGESGRARPVVAEVTKRVDFNTGCAVFAESEADLAGSPRV